MAKRLAILVLAGMASLACPLPALADVKDGVDAWSRGEWNAAVAQWRAPAEEGDPDALFNMGQAYRLGRGVPQNQTTAEAYYLRAAQGGHIRAADTYGLLLFQDGRREAALPYVSDAAERGDPRAQYLLGIAHFNGDIVGKDWVRAYALLTLANGQGLPQAAPALAEMDKHIPLTQRQQAASLAVSMQQQADATRGRELASADLAMGATASAPPPQQSYGTTPQPFTPGLTTVQGSSPRTPQPVAAAPIPQASPRVPVPIASAEVEPSVLAARRAVEEAMEATGTEDPSQAGADYARPAAQRQPGGTTPARATQPAPRSAAAPAPRTAPASGQASGAWKIQLGAFSVRGNAERLSNSIDSRPEVAGKTAQLIPTGRLTRLLFTGYATRNEAQAACTSLARSGQECVVTR